MAAVAALCGCGDSSSPTDVTVPEPTPAGLYGSCLNGQPCTEGSCFEFERPGDKVCSVECSTDDECPAAPAAPTSSPASTSAATGALCDSGHCRSYTCNPWNLGLVADDRICLHGKVMECADLTERPCECGCEDGTDCNLDSDLCMPVLALNEHCQKDYECATGYCGTKIDGYKSLCKKRAGASCDPKIQDPKLLECEALCTAPPGGAEGYCLQFMVHACGSNSCQTTCPEYFTGDDAAICRPNCHVDGDCKDWEQCTFAAVRDVDGWCVPKP